MLSIDETISCITYREKFHYGTVFIFSKFTPLPDSGFWNQGSRFWIHLVFHRSFHRDLQTKANMFCIVRTSFNWKDNYYVLYIRTFSVSGFRLFHTPTGTKQQAYFCNDQIKKEYTYQSQISRSFHTDIFWQLESILNHFVPNSYLARIMLGTHDLLSCKFQE